MVGLFTTRSSPAPFGGDLVKAYFIAQAHPERKTRAVATVLIDRAMGLFGLILFAAVCGGVAWALGDPIISANPSLQKMVQIMAAIAVGSVAGFLLLGLLPQRRVDRFAGRLKSIPKIGGSLAELWYAVWMYRQRLKYVAIGVGVTAVAHVGLVTAFHAASKVFHPTRGRTGDVAEHAVIARWGSSSRRFRCRRAESSARPRSRASCARGAAETRRSSRLSPASRSGSSGYRYIVYLRMKSHHELPTVEEENGEPPDKTMHDATGPPAPADKGK